MCEVKFENKSWQIINDPYKKADWEEKIADPGQFFWSMFH